MLEFALTIVLTILFLGIGVIVILIIHGVFEKITETNTSFKSSFESHVLKKMEIMSQPSVYTGDQFGDILRTASYANLICVTSRNNNVYIFYDFQTLCEPFLIEQEIQDLAIIGNKYIAVAIKHNVLIFDICKRKLIDTIPCYLQDVSILLGSKTNLYVFSVNKSQQPSLFCYFISSEGEAVLDFTLNYNSCSHMCSNQELLLFVSNTEAYLYSLKTRELEASKLINNATSYLGLDFIVHQDLSRITIFDLNFKYQHSMEFKNSQHICVHDTKAIIAIQKKLTLHIYNTQLQEICDIIILKDIPKEMFFCGNSIIVSYPQEYNAVGMVERHVIFL